MTSLKMIGEEANINFKSFICDAVADIANLPTLTDSKSGFSPCAHGSECFCVENGKTYYLTGNNIWVGEV